MTYVVRVSLLVGVLVLVILIGGGAFSASTDTRRQIVMFDNPPPQNVVNVLVGAGITVLYNLALVNALAVEPLPPSVGPDPALALLQGLPGVKQVSDDVLTFIDPICPTTAPAPVPEIYHWGPQQIEVPAVDPQWPQIQGSAAVTVAVLDIGIQFHPELSGRTAPGWNAITETGRPYDVHSHGTPMAGIITTAKDQRGTIGVTGVEPSIKVAAVKVLDDTGAGYLSVPINGLQWVLNNDIALANMSFGFSFSRQSDGTPLMKAIQDLSKANIIMVASAGNACCAGGACDDTGGDDCGPA
jgi:Subtilase family